MILICIPQLITQGIVKVLINALCNLSQLKADSWGPSHEVGHSNQTRPGLKWTGMTEVTNNIHSMYMQRINSGDSRLWLKGYYPNAMTTAFTGTPHIKVGKGRWKRQRGCVLSACSILATAIIYGICAW